MQRSALLLFAATGLVLLAEDKPAEPVSPVEWLVRGVSLNDSEKSVAARFGAQASRIRSGVFTTLAFYRDPEGVTQSHGHGEDASHGHHGEADACNQQPPWSVHVRDGQIQSIVATPASPIPLDAAASLRLEELATSTIGGILVKAWRVRGQEALVAIGVDPKSATAGQWVLIRQPLISQVYPELAAALPGR
ncbi:MAG: hypothetical protein HXY18_10465 [Bryobacteraceae bacterium]|nr:hypothetical protein [Bryobacteraceae bacterium]